MARWLWSSLLRLIARNRAVTLALLSAIASVLMGLAVTWNTVPAGTTPPSSPSIAILGFGIAVLLIVLAGAVPAEYEAGARLDFMLPVIHEVLGLSEGDRITVHRLRRYPQRGYEQLTEYYPASARRTSGRIFPISHGIVAQCFSTRHPIHWSVPAGRSFDEAMIERWTFTDEEIRRLTPDRRSFLAFPIGQDGPYAHAVLYLDSPQSTTFDGTSGDAAVKRLEDLFEAQLALALRG